MIYYPVDLESVAAAVHEFKLLLDITSMFTQSTKLIWLLRRDV